MLQPQEIAIFLAETVIGLPETLPTLPVMAVVGGLASYAGLVTRRYVAVIDRQSAKLDRLEERLEKLS